MKRHTTAIIAILLATFALLISCSTTSSYPVQIRLTSEKTYGIHTELQSAYLNDKDITNIKHYANGSEDLSSPLPVTLSWEAAGQSASTDYRTCVYEDKDMAILAYEYTGKQTKYSFYNVKVGMTYYYTVEAIEDGETVGLAAGKFKTDGELPRNIKIDQITNCRDVGGYKTSDGGRMKQGLFYRTAKLNKNNMVKVNLLISEEGMDTMMNQLGIKSELDLRRDASNEVGGLTDTSALGEGVNYYCCAMMNTFPIIQPLSYEGIVEAFDVLADESNYPIFMHCSIGTDRTGLIAFFVQNLCGVSEEDIYHDYLFSNFGNIGSERTYRQGQVYFDTISTFEGKNWTEKTRSFLRSIGVTDETMDAVVRIMKEN